MDMSIWEAGGKMSCFKGMCVGAKLTRGKRKKPPSVSILFLCLLAARRRAALLCYILPAITDCNV
jgi:hypothetical protein